MNEQNREKLQGLCPHGNNPSSCVICDKEKVAGTVRNKVSNFIRTKYKKFVEPTVQKINTARGKPTAESIASQLENSEPFDMEKFMANLPKDEKKTEIDKHGDLKNEDAEKSALEIRTNFLIEGKDFEATDQETTVSTGEDWQLAVEKEFGKMIQQNPNFVPTIFGLTKQIDALPVLDIPRKTGNIEMSLIYNKARSHVYKIKCEAGTFALKIENRAEGNRKVEEPNEWKSLLEANNIIINDSDLQQLNVKTIPFKMGYVDKQNSYLISQFKPEACITVQEAVTKEGKGNFGPLAKRFQKVADILTDKYNFYDVSQYNCFYDPTTEEMILFDIIQRKPLAMEPNLHNPN